MKDQLISWLNKLSVKSGEEFTLASGQKSNIYVDVKKTALHWAASKILARLLHEEIIHSFGSVHTVGGVVLGGCHLASIVAMQDKYGLNVVFVRKEAKEHGTKNLIERPEMYPGQSIVLLEDVITTGTSAVKAAHLLEQEGYQVKGIVAVVDRRVYKTSYLDNFRCVALVNFEELSV